VTVTLQPTANRVLVSLRPLPEMTGSIHRVSRSEYARAADVIAVGPEVRDVKVGDVVLVSALAGQLVGDNVLMPEAAIMGHIDDD
jgi:co-chaperonin GroES (HSP10)